MILSAIIEDNLENFKKALENGEKCSESNFNSIVLHKSFFIFKFLIEELKISYLDDYSLESINEFDNAVDWAKIIIANNAINEKSIENSISYFIKEDLGAFVFAALELEVITLKDIDNIQTITESNNINILTHLVNGEKITYDYENHEILISACYQGYTEIVEFILPFYQGKNAPYETLEGLIEGKDIQILEKVLNNCFFEVDDLNEGFLKAISEDSIEFTTHFFNLINDKIDYQKALEHAAHENILNVCYFLIDKEDIDVSFDYFYLLELAIHENYEENSIYFIDKILNHKSSHFFLISEYNITQSLEYNIDIFFKIFPLFQEYTNELSPFDNNIVIEAAKQSSLKAFKMIYTEDIATIFNENEDHLEDLLNNAIYSPAILEFLLLEKNIDILDCYSFVEDNAANLTPESFNIILKRKDFIVRNELIINLTEYNKVELIEILLKDKRINNIQNFNVCITANIHSKNEESLMLLFENKKIIIQDSDMDFYLNIIISRNFKNIFKFLIDSEQYSNFCLNKAFISSSKINEEFILKTLISDKRVTEFNFENKEENILCNVFNNLSSHSFYKKEKLINFLLSHEKIDTNVCDFEILTSLITNDHFKLFTKVFLKENRSEKLISRLFEFSVKKPSYYQSLNSSFYNYLYETGKVDFSYNDYKLLLSLLENNAIDIFYDFVTKNEIPADVLSVLFKKTVEYSFIDQHKNAKYYNKKSYLEAVCSQSNIDNSTDSYNSLIKLLKLKDKTLFKKIYNTKKVPDDIVIRIFENNFNYFDKEIALFLYEDIINKGNIDKNKIFKSIYKDLSYFIDLLENLHFLFEENENDKIVSQHLKNIFIKIVKLDYNSKYEKVVRNIFDFNKKQIIEDNNIYKLYFSKYIKNSINNF